MKIYESDSYLNFLLEYQEGGTLGELIEKGTKLGEENIRLIAAQLLLSIDFMSHKHIVHRDLKPDNILINSKEDGVYDIRIADFGFAMILKQERTIESNVEREVVCGTAGYMAPEVLDH